MTALYNPTVLVLNRYWQAISVRTPADAFSMMATGAARALDTTHGEMQPVTWEQWLALPVHEGEASAGTVRGAVRVPSVIVLSRYAQVPRKRLKFGLRGIWERDGGVCQYTGRQLTPGEGSIDHVVPVSRGGRSTWENCVLAHKSVNHRKADRTPDEAGLRLLRRPLPPRELPVTAFIRNHLGLKDWEPFLLKAGGE